MGLAEPTGLLHSAPVAGAFIPIPERVFWAKQAMTCSYYRVICLQSATRTQWLSVLFCTSPALVSRAPMMEYCGILVGLFVVSRGERTYSSSLASYPASWAWVFRPATRARLTRRRLRSSFLEIVPSRMGTRP